jgi:hypothetical protein
MDVLLFIIFQVTDVTSADFRCYDTETNPTAQTITIAAGTQLGIVCDQTIYHQGVSFLGIFL